MNLQHYPEFEEVLAKYHISPRAQAVLNQLTLVLMIGASSTGRNTIIRHQVQTGRYYYIVSDTTRQPRINDGVPEQNGREYWFRGEDEMLADLKAGEFIEAELIHKQQVSGISIRELQKALAAGKTAITDVDIEGMHNIVRAKPDTIAVMLLPPSFEEWQKRLNRRGVMRPDEERRRLETAQKIFEDGLRENYYHFVISENIDQSAAIIDAIVAGQANPHQGRGSGVIEHLQSALRDKLAAIY